MTSEEIKQYSEAAKDCAKGLVREGDVKLGSDAMLRVAAWEIAYQLARANEAAVARDPLGVVCQCGHRVRDHGLSAYGSKMVCYVGDCLCADKRPA